MIYTIHNDYLTVSVSSFGAELQSIRSGSNREYLWQGDLSIWSGRAPNLFPFVARLRDGVYRMDDKEYSMKIHGFAKYLEFECVKEEKDALVFELTSNEETLAQYPRDFRFQIGYSLNANGLSVTYTVVNLDKRTMFFGIGGHPGFNVPMEEGKK
ncbi:MAG: aldose 1-epimerase family protein, partial [Oscillospiraceae bacterium]|nr:aldose 1-epimerase family protein [Oscillospiraceae bacterium]